jgi:hypothetical protein
MMQREDLTPCCLMQQEDFCDNHLLDSPLHHAAKRSSLQNAAARFDYLLLHAAAGFDSTNFESNLKKLRI